jgi:hypothetical protein
MPSAANRRYDIRGLKAVAASRFATGNVPNATAAAAMSAAIRR